MQAAHLSQDVMSSQSNSLHSDADSGLLKRILEKWDQQGMPLSIAS